MDAVDILDGKVNPGVRILMIGVRPNNPLEEAARALGKEVYVIGDASQPAPANKATEAALDAVLKLG